MPRNIELKARCDDQRAAHHVARQLGATPCDMEEQRDTYFTVATGRLKLREIIVCGAASVDSNSARNHIAKTTRCELIWYVRTDQAEPRSSDYVLAPIGDAESLRAALRGALGISAVVEKHRTIYLHKNVRIHIDRVLQLGAFIEFEAMIDENGDEAEARARLASLCEAFDVTDGDILAGSYHDLLLQERMPPKGTESPPNATHPASTRT